MKCNSCRGEIYYDKYFKCIVCKKIFCLDCRPFNRSPICIEHYKMIPWKYKKEFVNFCLKTIEKSYLSEMTWITSYMVFLLLPILLALFIGPERFFAIIYSFFIVTIIIYASSLIIYIFAGIYLIQKKKETKILKFWKEIMGNPIIL